MHCLLHMNMLRKRICQRDKLSIDECQYSIFTLPVVIYIYIYIDLDREKFWTRSSKMLVI
jgi:hypothetical protein